VYSGLWLEINAKTATLYFTIQQVLRSFAAKQCKNVRLRIGSLSMWNLDVWLPPVQGGSSRLRTI